jgi:hypothetical protein
VAADKPAVERRQPPNAQMRLINPHMRRLVGRGRAGDQFLLLPYVGRPAGAARTGEAAFGSAV